MPTFPPNPNLDQLRHQAKELLRAAENGDPDATRRLQDVSERPSTLAVAQLAIARGYGFPSWARLKEEVEARALDLAQKADAFCEASISGRPGRALRLLAETPELAAYNFATAVILGDIDRVGELLGRDPSLATRVDPRTGWTALHAACASRWHQLEPARADALRSVAELLIAVGADPTSTTERRAGWTPLRCVIASASSGPSNRPIVELLLATGAVPNDHDLYLAGFAHDRRELLALLLDHVPDVRAITEQALAAPVSNHDTAAARVVLEAGADPTRYQTTTATPPRPSGRRSRAASPTTSSSYSSPMTPIPTPQDPTDAPRTGWRRRWQEATSPSCWPVTAPASKPPRSISSCTHACAQTAQRLADSSTPIPACSPSSTRTIAPHSSAQPKPATTTPSR